MSEFSPGSWDRTFSDIETLPTIEPDRFVREAGTYAIEPASFEEAVQRHVRRITPPAIEGTRIRITQEDYYPVLTRLTRLANDPQWADEAKDASKSLIWAATHSSPTADLIEFYAPTDTAIWSLVANPDFDAYFPEGGHHAGPEI